MVSAAETVPGGLIGRERECARIDRLLTDVADGEGCSLVIRGEPGIGKTALLDYAAGRAAAMTVLRVEGVETESDLAFGGLFGLLRPVADRLDRLIDVQRRALAGALGIAEAGPADRLLISAAVLALLGAAAEDAALVCLIDDAQWLDVPSAEALVFAARRLHAERAAVVFAAREVGERRFEARGLPELLLTGVDEGAAEQLLALSMSGSTARAVRSRLLAEAAGNPLALLELPRGLSDAQLDGREPLAEALPLTPRLQEGFRRLIDRLPEACRMALLVAAADGTGELAAVVRALGALDLCTDALDPAEELGLIRITGFGVMFRHPLVRAAVLERATLSRRQRAHRALASALHGAEHADRRVWHEAMATVTGDEDVAEEMSKAAERAQLRGAHASAATAFERAAALTLDPAKRAKRLGAAARVAWTAGDADRTRDFLGRALLLAGGAERARLLYIRGLLECRHGSLREGIAILLEGADASDDPALTLELLHEAAERAADTGQRNKVAELAERASAVPDSTVRARFGKTVLTGFGAMYSGRYELARAVFAQALDAADELADDPRAQIWASNAAAVGFDLGAGLPFASRAVELTRSQGRLSLLPMALEEQALQLYWSSQFDDAYAAAQEGYRLALDLGSKWGRHLTTVAAVEAIWGREAEAREHGAAVLALAQRSGETFLSSIVRHTLGLLELTGGRPQQAAEILVELITDQGPQTHPIVALAAVPDAAEATFRAGYASDVLARPLAWYRVWTDQAPTNGKRSLLARCEFLLGLRAAGDAFADAAEFAADLPLFQRARGELLYGEWLRRQRRRIDARPYLHSAADAFRALRAGPWEKRAEEELRASGETARKRDPSSLDQLTPREHQIAQLAAEGLTNPEIAARLFLSARTVEHHLSKAFAKLGVASRTELVRHGLRTTLH